VCSVLHLVGSLIGLRSRSPQASRFFHVSEAAERRMGEPQLQDTSMEQFEGIAGVL
jgi:hypothetical protein